MNSKYSLTDIPRDISKGETDKLGISPFEEGLTQFINQANTPITIALQGEWGSGKTSLMNTLNNNLCNGKDSQFFGIWINTWEYALMKEPYSALIDIIGGLAKSINEFSGNTTNKKLGDAIMRFGLMAVSATFNRGTDVVREILTGDNKSSISEIRSELETIINDCVKKQNKQGFIFFVDDLDRIDPPVAVQLLELLKNLFTLDHCIFVLAIDYDVVIKGLEPKFGKLSEQNEREFRSFFDKIIQVPFSMPITRYVIEEFLKENLSSINYISKQQSENKQLISTFSEISNLSVGTNPRALKRLLNSLLLIRCINPNNSNQSDEELDLLVNFTLVSIQIAYPLIYRILSTNPEFDKWDEEILTQMNLLPIDSQTAENKGLSEDWEKILYRICENDHYLKRLFPNISKLLNLLKIIIEEKGKTIEDTIPNIISLSSVTNLDAFEKPEPTGKREENGMKIGKFVQFKMKELQEKGLISAEEIQNLQDENYSKEVFSQNRPILKQKVEKREKNRYYSELFFDNYYLTSQWVEKHWDFFLHWSKQFEK